MIGNEFFHPDNIKPPIELIPAGIKLRAPRVTARAMKTETRFIFTGNTGIQVRNSLTSEYALKLDIERRRNTCVLST